MSGSDVLKVAQDGFASRWVLQEFVPGCCELLCWNKVWNVVVVVFLLWSLLM
jgi:hypothetical protein